MSEPSTGQRLSAALAWTALTDASLRGLQLGRECRRLLAWDDGPFVYLFDLDGRRIQHAKSPSRIISARMADNGQLVALLVEGPRILLLDEHLELQAERSAPAGALTLDMDPHGRFLAVSTRAGDIHLLSNEARPVARWSARQPFSHLRFVPGQPVLLGAAGYGMVQAFTLSAGTGLGKVHADPLWDERMLSNLGRLEVTGDGQTVLASCYNVGVQRYDRQGRNEGSYHLGGTVIHAVPDFPGRLIATATQEGELAILNRAGNVRWKSGVAKPPIALEFDPLGRFLIYGQESGEIFCLDFEGAISDRVRTGRAGAVPTAGGLRQPAWSIELARDPEEGQAAVLGVIDDPPRIGVAIRDNRFRIFDDKGQQVGEGPELHGMGRFVRTAPGWLVLGTDRELSLYDATRDAWHRPKLDLVQVTHLIASPDRYGMAIVQERDRLGRATLAGRWVWRRDMRSGVEEIAIGPHGLTAHTNDDGTMTVLDAAGEPVGTFRSDPAEPLLLADGPDATTTGAGPTWITLARREQVLRGHGSAGEVLWETPTPWEGWRLERVGPLLVVSAPDGRALAYDARGFLQLQSDAESGTTQLFQGRDGRPRKLVARGEHLTCVDFAGRVDWRSVGETKFSPIAASASGAACMQARSLTWFPSAGA